MDTNQDIELQQAAFEGNLERLREILEEGKVNVNGVDKHGNTALILALHFKREAAVIELLKHGADSGLKSKSGWSPMRYALASAFLPNIKAIHRANVIRERKNLIERLPAMIDALKSMPDFYCELRWEFSSWVPFVTRFCPSDTYKIWKKGGNFRVDTTLVGFDSLKWIRGKLSILFRESDGKGELPGEVFIVDYTHERYENATEIQLGLHQSDGNASSITGGGADKKLEEESIKEEQVEREIREMFGHPLVTTQAATSGCRFEPILNWRGIPKEDTVSGYKCKMLSMDGFVYRALQRQIKDAPANPDQNLPVDHSTGDDLGMSWDRYQSVAAAPNGKVPLLYKNEFVTGKEKVFKGTVWMASQFARKATDFLPIFECMVLSNQPKRFEKLADFVRLKLPDDGFPIKVELPVFPTISGQASFLVYEEKQSSDIDDELFQVPASFNKTRNIHRKAKQKKAEATPSSSADGQAPSSSS